MQFSDEIIKTLNTLSAKFGVMVDFTNQTVLPYLQKLSEKYICYRISLDVFWISLSVVFFLLSMFPFLFPKIRKKEWTTYRCYDYYPTWKLTFAIIAFIIGFIMIIVIACNVYDIIQCKTFPEKVLFEYITSLKNK